MNPASPARTIPPEHVPPLDLADFRARYARIVRARDEARREAEEAGIAEAEAEHAYLKRRAIRMAHHRHEEKASWDAAAKLAEGDVADHRRERDTQRVLAKAAWARWQELSDNKSMLNREAQMSEGLE